MNKLETKVFTAGQAAAVAGVAYHHVNHWCKTGLLEPSVARATGSDSLRLYSFGDVLALRVIGQLRSAGLALECLGGVARHLQSRSYASLPSDLYLMGRGDGAVDELPAAVLLKQIGSGKNRFAWILNLADVTTELAAAARTVERPSRGRASKVA